MAKVIDGRCKGKVLVIYQKNQVCNNITQFI